MKQHRLKNHLLLAASLLGAAALLTTPPQEINSQMRQQVKVVVEFKQSGTSGRETLGGTGGVIITRKSMRPDGRVVVEDTQTKTQRSTGIFTLVQDGGESSMLVATKVPYTEAIYYQNYLTGAGYTVARVAFLDVGTALKVRAQILPQNQIRVQLMPRISYFTTEGGGAIDVTEAATELIVPHGQPIFLGGATSQMHEVTRQLLGFDSRQGSSETSITLTATIQ